MLLLDKITADLTVALKEKDAIRVSILRFLIAQLHNAKIAKGNELSDDEILFEIAKEVKRHKESIAAYEAGSRQDLVAKEKAELSILESYLPLPLTDAQLAKMVDEAIGAVGAKTMADMGKVIGAVMKGVGTRADGAKVAQIVKERLS